MERTLGYEDCPACGGKGCVRVTIVEMAIEEGHMLPGEIHRFCSRSDCPTRTRSS
jgi:hypothetical protein